MTGAINNSAFGRRLPRWRLQYTPCSVKWSGPIQQPLRTGPPSGADTTDRIESMNTEMGCICPRTDGRTDRRTDRRAEAVISSRPAQQNAGHDDALLLSGMAATASRSVSTLPTAHYLRHYLQRHQLYRWWVGVVIFWKFHEIIAIFRFAEQLRPSQNVRLLLQTLFERIETAIRSAIQRRTRYYILSTLDFRIPDAFLFTVLFSLSPVSFRKSLFLALVSSDTIRWLQHEDYIFVSISAIDYLEGP